MDEGEDAVFLKELQRLKLVVENDELDAEGKSLESYFQRAAFLISKMPRVKSQSKRSKTESAAPFSAYLLPATD